MVATDNYDMLLYISHSRVGIPNAHRWAAPYLGVHWLNNICYLEYICTTVTTPGRGLNH